MTLTSDVDSQCCLRRCSTSTLLTYPIPSTCFLFHQHVRSHWKTEHFQSLQLEPGKNCRSRSECHHSHLSFRHGLKCFHSEHLMTNDMMCYLYAGNLLFVLSAVPVTGIGDPKDSSAGYRHWSAAPEAWFQCHQPAPKPSCCLSRDSSYRCRHRPDGKPPSPARRLLFGSPH